MREQDACALCQRDDVKLTKHHLIPRSRHRKNSVRKAFGLAEARSRILWVCRSCHSQIHAVLSDQELEKQYNTLESLMTHPDIMKYIDWARGRKLGGKIPVRKKK